MNTHAVTDSPPPGPPLATDFTSWSEEVVRDFTENQFNGRAGKELLSENERVRIWGIRLAPGERVPAHRHVLDYFWTALNAGHSRQHIADGTTRQVEYTPGETRHFTFGPGEYLLHDLENTGTTELLFTTVEFKNSANDPLPLD